jgi:hypothetical protein
MEPARGRCTSWSGRVTIRLGLLLFVLVCAPATVLADKTNTTPGAPDEAISARRIRVRDFDGREVIARLYTEADNGVVLLPDGRLGWPRQLLDADEPFVPDTAEAIVARLTAGPFRGFQAKKTEHYVVLYQGSERFAQASASLLESLYQGLSRKLAAKGLPVHPPEFPLVAIIYPDEEAFRAASPKLPEDVQAYYDVVSNRIHFYETSERDREAPDVAARRRPQTVAHEGTHQILQNIGIQRRLANWPPWIVEGLAEYFAPTSVGKDGSWDGANKINPFHMATIRDLNDPLAYQGTSNGPAIPRIGHDPRQPVVSYLLTRTDLSPTDYALSWALTHFLANKHFERFLAYLRELGKRAPLQPFTPEQNLAEFRTLLAAPYRGNLAQLDRAFNRYLSGLRENSPQPYYAVTFEQPIGPGVVRRAVLVSQSQALIHQWVEEMTAADGGPVTWRARPFPTRTRARLAAEQWLNNS